MRPLQLRLVQPFFYRSIELHEAKRTLQKEGNKVQRERGHEQGLTGFTWLLSFKMGNFEKLISELFGTIWNETKLAGHLPNRTPTLPQRAKAIPRSAQQRASTSVPLLLPGDHMQSVGCSATPTVAEIMIGMIKTVMLMSISSLDLG